MSEGGVEKSFDEIVSFGVEARSRRFPNVANARAFFESLGIDPDAITENERRNLVIAGLTTTQRTRGSVRNLTSLGRQVATHAYLGKPIEEFQVAQTVPVIPIQGPSGLTSFIIASG